MFEVFEDVRKGKYERNTVAKNGTSEKGKAELEKVEGPLTAEGLCN